MRTVIVGAGPVACLVAVELRRRAVEVDLYERRPDFRTRSTGRSHSFNLTLTLRGLRSVGARLREEFYAHGVPLPQRVIHHVDGSLSYQQYGTMSEHHLLSIPRSVLHRTLLNAAERAGARFHFEHECLGADPTRARLTVAAGGAGLREVASDMLIGCDGANSVVRQEMSRHGGLMHISQDYIAHGYAELRMPPTAGGEYALAEAVRDQAVPESLLHGLHIWPRGKFMLLAQPNVDHSYTTSLFMPLVAESAAEVGFKELTESGTVGEFFAKHFADVCPLLPDLSGDFAAAPPAPLRTLRCSPYHHGRTVLVGDAAHTMVPFYGQGINCSFEDVATLLELFDRHRAEAGDARAVTRTVADFTRARKPPGDAITNLSLANLRELSARTGQASYHVRSTLEKQLHRSDPDRFMPLYDMVAFTNIPYHEVVERHERSRPVVDAMLRRLGADGDPDSFVPVRTDPRPLPGLNLTPEEARALLGEVAGRLGRYHDDLAASRYPASYLHGAGADTRFDGAVLREDELPMHGSPVGALLDEVFDRAAADGIVHPHPGSLAQVPSGGLFQAAVGDFVARTLNRFVAVETASPGFARLENNVIRWFATMLGYGPGSFGYLTTGGSIANFMGLRCALTRIGAHECRATVYMASQGHYSVVKAARLAGVPAERVRVVGVHADNTMDLAELSAWVAADRRAGAVPAAVVATAGTTNTGAVDDLTALAAWCRTEDLWLHADACLGGFFRLTARGRQLLAGIEEADSIAVDAHKSLFLPHGTSALLVRERARLHEAFAVPEAAYIPELDTDDEPVDFCNYGPELSREVRGLTAWLPLKMHGVAAFEQALDTRLDLADHLAARLREIDGIEVVERGAPHLPVVAFVAAGRDLQARDRRTRRLCELICSRGHVYLATTRLQRIGLVVRACVLHPRTDESTVEHLLADLHLAIRTEDEELSA